MINPAPRACLVESIPRGLEDLRGTPGVQYTEDVLVRLTEAARSTIDLTAMYWALLPDPTSADEHGFSVDELKSMGASAGAALYQALHDAAGRGVHIRILQAPGFEAADDGTASRQESDDLHDAFPGQVEIHEITMGDWYGGSGIMHQKVWVIDGRHVYIGSANMDWKSLMQVKEVGVATEDCTAIAEDVSLLFESWWRFAALKPDSTPVLDPGVGIERMVPSWSSLVPAIHRKPSPLDADTTSFNLGKRLEQELGGETGTLVVSAAPDEVRGPARAWDGDALVDTISDARRSVCVSVMDFAPVGLYARKPIEQSAAMPDEPPVDTPVWWPPLFDALLSAVLTRKVWVRLLVSRWAHTSGMVEPYLRALQQAADAGRDDKYLSAGQLEIKQFEVPGWDATSGSYRTFPGHTRVNHTKYIVTDRRINVGTSNMTWDYFASTAGASFNADHPTLVHTLQTIFDRDWASSYAHRLG